MRETKALGFLGLGFGDLATRPGEGLGSKKVSLPGTKDPTPYNARIAGTRSTGPPAPDFVGRLAEKSSAVGGTSPLAQTVHPGVRRTGRGQTRAHPGQRGRSQIETLLQRVHCR